MYATRMTEGDSATLVDHLSPKHKQTSTTRLVAMAAVALALALLVGCGAGDEAKPLTGDALVQRANDVCARHTEQIVSTARSTFPTKEVPSPDRLRAFAEQVVIPEIERQVDELEDLLPPEEATEEFDRYLDEAKRAVKKVKKAPTLVFSQVEVNDAFGEANAVANRLNLTACAQGSDKWARAPALPPQ